MGGVIQRLMSTRLIQQLISIDSAHGGTAEILVMHINGLHTSKEELSAIVINELAALGVKYRCKEKKTKVAFQHRQTSRNTRVFRTNLNLLELKEVSLADGRLVKIPKFLADAIEVILQQGIEVEGIFRRGGSLTKQKEIRRQLEAGLPILSEPNILNIADLVKAFFRELPEPLIPPSLQETLLQCVRLHDGNAIRAILLACLLLPQLNLDTLASYMQFMCDIAESAAKTQMSASNLAIVIMPGLFSSADLMNQSCVAVVEMLIENSQALGIIPESVIAVLRVSHGYETAAGGTPTKEKKKKKRPSDLFHGLKKMYTSTGSSENLVNTPDAHKALAASTNALASSQKNDQQQQHHRQQQQRQLATPCLKANTKKRQFAEPVCAFSAKKKRDLLALLPSNRGGPVPNTPLTKDVRKSRLSLGGHIQLTRICSNPVISSMERRWSSVGTSSSKVKTKYAKSEGDTASTASAPSSSLGGSISEAESSASCSNKRNNTTSGSDGDSFVRIPKNEYEALKQRAAALEEINSQAWRPRLPATSASLAAQGQEVVRVAPAAPAMTGPQLVQTKYEQMVVETEMLCSPSTDHLAKRLSRNLRIRQSTDQRVVRSPSARKIGNMRRRSQERVRVSRNITWHIASTSLNRAQPPRQSHEAPVVPVAQSSSTFYARSNLKRGRPNTLHTGLLSQPIATSSQPIAEQAISIETPRKDQSTGESWTSGEVFFSHLPLAAVAQPVRAPCNEKAPEPLTPQHVTLRQPNAKDKDNMPTPMLPPRSVPRRTQFLRTPNSAMRRTPALLGATSTFATRLALATPIAEDENRRESIARLRTQNAGMVMAKAKLFDDLGGQDAEPTSAATIAAKAARVAARAVRPQTTQTAVAAVRTKVVVGRGDNERSAPPSTSSSSKKRPLAERALTRNHKNAMAAASPRRPGRPGATGGKWGLNSPKPSAAQLATYRCSPRYVRTKHTRNQ